MTMTVPETRPVASNVVPLDAALKEKFQELHRNIRKNTVALAREAFQIHNQYYLPTEKRYDKAFEGWWKTQGLDEVFGSRSAWTKWHKAGETIEKVHAKFEQYADRLPVTLGALYEISQLDPTLELRLCLENTYKRTSLTQDEHEWTRPKKPRPLINPGATAATVRSWRKNWRQPRQPPTDRRRMPFITILVHGSLYDFDKTGNATGQITPDQITELNAKIVELLKPYDAVIRVDSKLEHLREGYNKRKEQAEKRKAKAALPKPTKSKAKASGGKTSLKGLAQKTLAAAGSGRR